MTTYYVATLARYVLVDAADEAEARRLAEPALHELYADIRERWGRDVPIAIRTVRLATADEIELVGWHQATLAAEKQVDEHEGCPNCGERRVDALIFEDEPVVRCTTCGGRFCTAG
jgi:DNA-directed RNA polymerase subunit RPC12/RpoP